MFGHQLSELIDELQRVFETHGDMLVHIVDSKNKPMQIISICSPTTRKETVIKIQ